MRVNFWPKKFTKGIVKVKQNFRADSIVRIVEININDKR